MYGNGSAHLHAVARGAFMQEGQKIVVHFVIVPVLYFIEPPFCLLAASNIRCSEMLKSHCLDPRKKEKKNTFSCLCVLFSRKRRRGLYPHNNRYRKQL